MYSSLLSLLCTNSIITRIYHKCFFILFSCKIIQAFLHYYSIKENIANFSSYVLIDIHRGESNEEDTDKSDVEIILAEKCENYSENLSLANTLNEELVNRGIKTKIVQYKEGINNFNLHLSKKSIVLNVGDETMSVEEINKILDSISESFSTILQ